MDASLRDKLILVGLGFWVGAMFGGVKAVRGMEKLEADKAEVA